MYQFSQRFKITTLILMGFGLLGLGYGFMSAPTTIEEAKAIMASHEGDHGGEHHSADHSTLAEAHHGNDESHHTATEENTHSEGHDEPMSHDTHATSADEHDSSHDQHVLDQMKNRPWSAFYVGALFSFLIALGVLAFYAINRAAQAGWSPLLFRVMEGITSYLIPGGIILFIFFVLSGLHMNHLFVWMDADVVAHDKLIQNKSGYLNTPFFLIRAALYIGGWIAYRQYSRKLSLAEETASDNKPFITNFKLAAGFLAFFLVSESMMSWDWIMSLDPHWFSTLFGWYVFASFFVSGITVIALLTLYLKSKGLLESVNSSHVHDLAKFMFGISIFWTYLWFSQFMLIWYADIPEEVTYYVMRFEAYKVPFLGMLVLNFIFPLLVIMRSDHNLLHVLRQELIIPSFRT
jgi:hypothetical protein